MDKNYSENPYYIERIEMLAEKHAPIIPLKGDSTDDLILTARSLAQNKGFIMGYETAIKHVLKLYEKYESVKDMNVCGIRKVFEDLISCYEEN